MLRITILLLFFGALTVRAEDIFNGGLTDPGGGLNIDLNGLTDGLNAIPGFDDGSNTNLDIGATNFQTTPPPGAQIAQPAIAQIPDHILLEQALQDPYKRDVLKAHFACILPIAMGAAGGIHGGPAGALGGVLAGTGAGNLFGASQPGNNLFGAPQGGGDLFGQTGGTDLFGVNVGGNAAFEGFVGDSVSTGPAINIFDLNDPQVFGCWQHAKQSAKGKAIAVAVAVLEQLRAEQRSQTNQFAAQAIPILTEGLGPEQSQFVHLLFSGALNGGGPSGGAGLFGAGVLGSGLFGGP